jgi:hypothetical protein
MKRKPYPWTRIVFTLFASSLLLNSASAIQTWNVPGTADWFTASNWTPIGVPNSTQSASINNGGTATATAGSASAFLIDAGKNGGTGHIDLNGANVRLQSSFDIGDVEGTLANGSGTNISSEGTALIRNAGSIELGLGGLGDLNAGQTSASNGATAAGSGSVTIETANTVQMTGDLDIGQSSGSGSASGIGVGTFTNVSGQFLIGEDFDIGQASAELGGMNTGMGTLTMDAIGELRVGADVDVAQSTGPGQAAGTAMATLSNIGLFSITDSLDVAKVRAFNTAQNQGNAEMRISESDLRVGFDSNNPGSIEISRVLSSESARGTAVGTLILDQVNANVANDVIVGELALSGGSSNSSSQAMLHLIDSKLDTRDLSVATRFDNSPGTVSGSLRMTRSLSVIQSLLQLSIDATLQMEIDGTTRALGDGNPSDYSAIDADMAELAGTLAIEMNAAYPGPTTRGEQTEFQLINTLFGITGSFDDVTVNGNSILLSGERSYVGATHTDTDGMFAAYVQDGDSVSLLTYLAIPGDANGDGSVDVSDFNIWNSNKFQGGNDWSSGDFNGDGITDVSDFNVWNSNKFTSADTLMVPEPTNVFGLLVVFLFLMTRAVRQNRRQIAGGH